MSTPITVGNGYPQNMHRGLEHMGESNVIMIYVKHIQAKAKGAQIAFALVNTRYQAPQNKLG